MRHTFILAALALAGSLLEAQSLPRPAGWRVLTDGASRDTVHYVQMPPGWHMTTGPGAVLFDSDYQASGRFAVEAEIFVFPNSSEAEYGIFVGGSALDGPAPSYIAFVVRRDGQAALRQLVAGQATALIPWRAAPTVKALAGGDEPARNILRLSVERDSLIMEANSGRVASIARADLPVDGVFGFRVGAGVNLHASRLDHLRRLAPVPVPKR